MLTATLLGFALGLRHAFDPDHVIAVSTIAARQRSPWTASWIGVSWGLGHGATVFAAGFAIIALGIAVPESFAHAMEFAVGALLVVLGVANLAASAPEPAACEIDSPRSLQSVLARSGLIGLAHGLAGSAAVVLLAMAAMPTPAAALVYLVVFAVGTIAGMVLFSMLVGTPFAALGSRPQMRRLVTASTGLASLVFGAYLMYEIGSLPGFPA